MVLDAQRGAEAFRVKLHVSQRVLEPCTAFPQFVRLGSKRGPSPDLRSVRTRNAVPSLDDIEEVADLLETFHRHLGRSRPEFTVESCDLLDSREGLRIEVRAPRPAIEDVESRERLQEGGVQAELESEQEQEGLHRLDGPDDVDAPERGTRLCEIHGSQFAKVPARLDPVPCEKPSLDVTAVSRRRLGFLVKELQQGLSRCPTEVIVVLCGTARRSTRLEEPEIGERSFHWIA